MLRLLVLFAVASSNPMPSYTITKPVARTILLHETSLYEVSKRAPQEAIVQRIVTRYNVDRDIARAVVQAAHKQERDRFPKAKDIIAIVGIESSFDPKAKSQLKQDPALGLMQIRPGVWKMSPNELLTIEKNVEHGAAILEHYYNKLGKKRDSAVQAYNIGITAYLEGEKNSVYLKKYKREVALYAQK